MPFNTEAFERAQFVPRQESVSVPALADFFDSEPYEWVVRGLSGNELNRALDAGKRQKDIGKLVEAIGQSGAQVEDIRKAIGLSDKTTPGEIAKRIEMLTIASVEPIITMPVAVRLAENFPIEFMQLTNSISTLTGQGAEMVKPDASSRETQS
jgi:hypothetical protein